MPPSSPPDSAAASVLRDSWGIAAVPDRVARGASRNTWRVDSRFWLSHSDATEGASLHREAQLLEALPALLEAHGAAWRVPPVVRTLTHAVVATTGDGVWRLSGHLCGEEPDMQSGDTYPLLARKLAELHARLEFVPRSLAVRESGAVERARAFIFAYEASSFLPATNDPREERAVRALVAWLAPRVGALASLPTQLTHGDWIPPNIKVGSRGWGVLDWEFSRVDPVEMDVAQSCSTILMWSGLGNPAEHIAAFVEMYGAHSGRVVSVATVRTAMVVYWLQNYLHWRCRQDAAAGFEDVLVRQPGRLLTIAEFVGAV